MRVLVTGGTGFVGAHTVGALTAAGHDVRLLVRNPARVAPAIGPLDIGQELDIATGDVTDAHSVREALAGCQAAVHTAAMVTFDRREAERANRVNVNGTRTVLSAAADAGLDPVIYVSSVSALHPPSETILTPASPVTPSSELYAGSKAGAELVARQLQADGAPVVITYPGGVWGPHDPNFGENARAAVWLMRMGFVPQTAGGYLVIDVRDLGLMHAAALEPGRGPRRYMAGGTFFSGRELADRLAAVTGRRIVSAPAPTWSLRASGRIGDRIQQWLPVQLPFTSEGMDTLVRSVPTDDSATHDELGVVWRDPAETLTDTLRWLAQEGRLRRREVGRLAP